MIKLFISAFPFDCNMVIFFSLFILIRQHGVSDKDTSVRRFLHREEDQYRMDAEVEYLDKLFLKVP